MSRIPGGHHAPSTCVVSTAPKVLASFVRLPERAGHSENEPDGGVKSYPSIWAINQCFMGESHAAYTDSAAVSQVYKAVGVISLRRSCSSGPNENGTKKMDLMACVKCA